MPISSLASPDAILWLSFWHRHFSELCSFVHGWRKFDVTHLRCASIISTSRLLCFFRDVFLHRAAAEPAAQHGQLGQHQRHLHHFLRPAGAEGTGRDSLAVHGGEV